MTNVLDYVSIMGAVVLATTLLLRWRPGLGRLVLGEETSRKHALDGLRGVLALSVLVHHLLLGHLAPEARTEARLPAYSFVMQTGSASVAVFFMISAYLFGGRILRSGGALDVAQFFFGRFMRIVPLYVFAVAMTVLIAFSKSGFRLVEPAETVIKEIVRQLLFDFVPRHGINGFDDAWIVLAQVWSLRFEWLLYLLIPVMALLLRVGRSQLLVYVPLIILAVFYDSLFYMFIAGIACTQIEQFYPSRVRYLWFILGIMSPIVLVLIFSKSDSWPQALILLPLLMAVVLECPLIKLLGMKPLRFLGEISFSIYLLHGIVFQAHGALLGGLEWSHLRHGEFIVQGILVTGLTVVVSTVTFRCIEQPLMKIRLKRQLSVVRQKLAIDPLGLT